MVSARRPQAVPPAVDRDEPLPFGAGIPDDEWQHYRPVLLAAQARGIPFALGGGFAYSLYSGLWRNTKDIDLYILPQDRDRIVRLVTEAGFTDYHDDKPYDRSWIYRSTRGGVICDLIWTMPNHRATVDERWLTAGQRLRIRDVELRAIPVEELIFAKLYVLQRDRCDWPDLLSVLHAQVAAIDWDHLLDRVQADVGLLAALVRVFAWLCPERAALIPEPVVSRLGLSVPLQGPDCATQDERVRLLDTRDWFVPLQLSQREAAADDAGQHRIVRPPV